MHLPVKLVPPHRQNSVGDKRQCDASQISTQTPQPKRPSLPETFEPRSIGLKNIGNTCFMNAILQCLLHTKMFSSFFLGRSYAEAIHGKTECNVAKAFCKLVEETQTLQANRHLSPSYIKQSIELRISRFQGNDQHDCHDLMLSLLNCIHEDLNQAKDKTQCPITTYRFGFDFRDGDGSNISVTAAEAWEQFKVRNDSIVVDTFQGQFLSRVTCSECNLTSVRFDPYHSLQIPISDSDDETDLNTLLQAYTGVYQLTGANAYDCSNCQQKVSAAKQIQLWKSSDILVVQLMRFKCSNGRYHRVNTLVNVSLDEVDFSSYFAPDSSFKNHTKYRLYAVSNHNGALNNGHCWAHCRLNDSWVNLNDDRVEYITDNIITTDAYLLFFQRVSNHTAMTGESQSDQDIAASSQTSSFNYGSH
jgi:ubiquitin carboxyl-terminal hydrolase 8